MGMGTSVGSIFVSIGADTSGLVSGFSRAEREIERFGSRVFFLGSRMTAGVTLPIIGAAMAIGKFGAEFDKAMTESLAIMSGVTPKIRKDMEEVARTISETSKYSAKQAAEGFYHLASAGYTAAESMKLLPVTTKFAQAGVMDLAKATEYLAGAQQSLGMRMEDPIENAKEMARIADVLTEANNRALGTIEDFAQAINNKAGAQLRIYNKTVEEGVAALMALASQNVKGRLAGQQLYMVLRDLARFSLANTEAWKKYNVSVYDASGNMRNMSSIIVDLDKAMSGMSVLKITNMFKEMGFTDRTRAAIQYFRGMGEEMKGYENALLSAGGATDRVARNQMQAFSNQLQVVWNKIKNVAIELFSSFAPTILNTVIPAVERMIEWFSEFARGISQWSETTKVFVLAFLALAAAMSPVIVILGSGILFSSAILGGFTAVGEGVRAITRAVVIGAQAWRDYALAQGAVSLSQSLGWASTAFGAAGAKATGPATRRLGPGAGSMVSAGLLAYQARELAGRRASVITAAAAQASRLSSLPGMTPAMAEVGGQGLMLAAAQQAAIMTAMSTKSKLWMAEMSRLRALGATNTGLMATEAVKSEGILSGIVTRIMSVFTKLGVTLTALKLGGWVTAALATLRYFADSWEQVFNVIVTATMGSVAVLFQSFKKLWSAILPEFPDLQKFIGESVGSWDDWKQAILDWGSASWYAIHSVVTEIENLGFAIGALDKTNKIPLKTLVQEGKRQGMSIPQALSLFTYAYGARDEDVADSWIAARKAHERQVKDLRGSGNQPLSGLSGTASQFTTPAKAPDFQKEYDRAMYQLRDATPKERQAAFDALVKKYQDQMREGAYPEGSPKPSKPERIDRNLQSQQRYYDTARGDDQDLENMAKGFVAAALGFFIDSPDATSIPLAWAERMWADYKKYKDTLAPEEITGTVKVLDELTRSLWEQEAILRQMAEWDKKGYWKSWSEELPGVDKKVRALVASFEELGLNTPEQVGFLPIEFFKDNEEAISELAATWGTFPESIREANPVIDALIARFGGLIKAGQLGTDKTKAYFDTLHAGLVQMGEDAAAKLSDAESTLDVFLEGQFSSRQMKNLKQTWDKALEDIHKTYLKKMAEIAAIPIGPDQATQQLAEVKLLDSWRDTMEEVVKITRKTFKGNWAEAAGFSKSQQKGIAGMPDADFERLKKTIDAWGKLYEAVGKVGTVLSKFGTLLGMIGFEGFGASILAAAASFDTMRTAADTFVKAFPKGGPADYLTGIAAAIDMTMAFVAAMQLATREQRTLAGASSGAMAGASIGAMTGAKGGGVWGAVIGAIVGSVVAAVQGDPAWKRISDAIRTQFGISISEGVAQAIAESRTKLAMTIREADIFNLDLIIEEAGGVTATTIGKWSQKLSEAFTVYVEGLKKFQDASAAQALRRGTSPTTGSAESLLEMGRAADTLLDTFDRVFPLIADAVVKSGKIAGAEFFTLIKLMRTTGLESQALSDFISGQLTRAMTAWSKVAAPLAAWSTSFATARQDLIDFNKEMEGSGKFDPKTGKYLDLGVEDQKRLDEIQKNLKKIEEGGKGATVEVERLGRILMSAFNGAVASGLSWMEAMDLMGPQLDTLIQLYKDLGITSNNAALNALMHYQNLATQNAALVEGVRSLNELTLALSNLGALDAETLADLEAQGLQMYAQMITAGFTERETLMAMEPWLKTIWDAHKKLGIPIDENTQKLIDQAREMGLLEDEKTVLSVLEAGFKALVTAVTDLTNALLGIPSTVNTRINVHTNYSSSGAPGTPGDPNDPGDSGDPNNPNPNPNPQAYGGNYWVTRPTLFLAGEAGPEQAMFSGANRRFQGGETRGGTVIIKIGPRTLAELIVPHIPGVVREYGLG